MQSRLHQIWFPQALLYGLCLLSSTHTQSTNQPCPSDLILLASPEKKTKMAVISVHQFAQCITCHAWSPDQSSNHSSLLNSPSFLLISFVFYFNLVWFVVFVWILKVWCTFLDAIMIGSNLLFLVLRFLFWIKWSIRFVIYSLVFAVDLCSVWIYRYLIKLLQCF
jgi:hypothetical protein